MYLGRYTYYNMGVKIQPHRYCICRITIMLKFCCFLLQKMSETSPSKFIAIPGSKARQSLHFPDRPNSQPDHALSLDLSACSPGTGQTLYESPDPQMPLASPQTPHICASDGSTINRGFLYELSPQFEQSDLSSFQAGTGSLGGGRRGGGELASMDQLDLGWGYKQSPTTTDVGPHVFMEEDAVVCKVSAVEEPHQPATLSEDPNFFKDLDDIINTDCMLSSANISTAPEPQQQLQQQQQQQQQQTQQPQHVVMETPSMNIPATTKIQWNTPVMMSPPSSAPLEKQNLQAVLMGSVVPQSVPKSTPGLTLLQQSPILTQQLSKSAPEPARFTLQQIQPVIVSSSTILAPVQITNPIVVPTQSPLPLLSQPVVVQAGKASSVPFVQKDVPLVVSQKRSITPQSDMSTGSSDRRWEDAMDLINNEVKAEAMPDKIKLEPQGKYRDVLQLDSLVDLPLCSDMKCTVMIWRS